MKGLLLLHGAGAIIISLIAGFGVSQWAAVSYFLGAFLWVPNVLALSTIWSRIFLKKNIAPMIGLIVFKYAILVFFIIWISRQNWLDITWFGLGVSSLAFSAVVWALLINTSNDEGQGNGSGSF